MAQPTVLADLEDLWRVTAAMGGSRPPVGLPEPNGYSLELAYSWGVTFEHWIPPADAAVELAVEQLRAVDRARQRRHRALGGPGPSGGDAA